MGPEQTILETAALVLGFSTAIFIFALGIAVRIERKLEERRRNPSNQRN